ncbi:ComF family protein [soil metagenome]
MRIIEHFFRLIAPDECLNCGREGALLCAECCATALESIPPRCYRCNRLSEQSKTCPTCRHHSVIKNAWIRTSYTDYARKLVHELKFNYSRSAARIIAREIVACLPVLPKDSIITHVPTATSHVRQRGFDQSALIARELSALLKLPHVHLLARRGQQRQVGASREVRLSQMKEAFRVVSPYMVTGRPIILVDDVLTTGSTLESAAVVLRQSGAQSIMAACFAQAK